MNYIFREYQESDEIQICNLFKKSYGKSLDLKVWKWRYLDNPFGNKKISLCFDGDTLVGHYAVSPIIFVQKGQEFNAAQSMTTMTHPLHQGKGLFTKLANMEYQKLRNQKLDFVWGFPNRNSFYGFIKNLNWKPHLELPFLFCSEPLNDNICELGVATEVTKIEQLANLLHAYSNMGFFGIKKSQEYLKWRYADNPTFKYSFNYFYKGEDLVGVLVTKSYSINNENYVDVLDLICLSSYDCEQIISWIRFEFLKQKNVKGIFAWCAVNDPVYLSFFKNKFEPKLPLTYLGYLGFSDTFVKHQSEFNWRLSMGDSDVF